MYDDADFDYDHSFEDAEDAWLDDADFDDPMDGDFDSGMASAGFGTDEDYGYFGGDE